MTIVATVAALAAPCTLSAQQGPLPTGRAADAALRDTTLVTQIPGRWQLTPVSADTRLTRAERSAMLSSLATIGDLLHAALGTLPGVEADVSENADRLATPDSTRIAGGSVKILLWPYSVRNGKLAFYDNASEAIFWVNHTVCVGDAAGQSGFGFILAPQGTGRYHGFPMLDSVVVITHRTEPPCIPVTRGEFLEAYARKIASDRAHDDSAWRAEAPKREKDLADAARMDPALAASARAQDAQMKRSVDSARTAIQQLFDAALARMSPAERASPAYLSGGGCRGDGDPSTCFVDASAPGARAVVRENPAFFDSARPGDVQIVTLSLKSLYSGAANAQYPTTVMNAALSRLDWSALSALVH